MRKLQGVDGRRRPSTSVCRVANRRSEVTSRSTSGSTSRSGEPLFPRGAPLTAHVYNWPDLARSDQIWTLGSRILSYLGWSASPWIYPISWISPAGWLVTPASQLALPLRKSVGDWLATSQPGLAGIVEPHGLSPHAAVAACGPALLLRTVRYRVYPGWCTPGTPRE